MNVNEQDFISILNRSTIEVKGVKDVLSYDGERILFDMGDCQLEILGCDFNIKKIEVENRIAEICGVFHALSYITVKEKHAKSFFSSLFK